MGTSAPEMPRKYMRAEDRIGQKFGYMTCTRFISRNGCNVKFEFTCFCGKTCEKFLNRVKQEGIIHCGCLSTHYHGQAGTAEYGIWWGVLDRCRNTHNHAFKYYGAKGVQVCERWNDFRNFLADMGKRPADDYSIDRIDPTGNYEPTNCRWITRSEQGRTRRDECYNWHVVCGIRLYVSDWAKLCGISRQLMSQRFNWYSPVVAVCKYDKARQWLHKQGVTDVPTVATPKRGSRRRSKWSA